MRAYHWYPSLESIVEFELLTIGCFEDEFGREFGKGDARVAVKFRGFLREGKRAIRG